MEKVKLEIAGIEVYITFKRMKRMILRYQNNQYRLSAPIGISLKEIERWIIQNETAIVALKDKAVHHADYCEGGYVDFFGERYTIKVRDMDKRLCVIHGQTLVVYHTDVVKTVEAFLKEQLRECIVQQIDDFLANGFPKRPASIRISKMTSRYGSCRLPEGKLHFSFYLCHFSYEDIRAVVIHELCHLLEPSHNQRFYSLVEHYLPTYKQAEKHLKQGGLTS